jgi:hypothetical protein
MAGKGRYLSLAQTERMYPSRVMDLPPRAQRATSLSDIFTARQTNPMPLTRTLKVEKVGPYTREGRRVSGYRRQRWGTMKLVSGTPEPVCMGPGCTTKDMEKLMIAHRAPNEFSGYAERSGGTRYSEWMRHVRQNPHHYIILCKTHHGKMDCRRVPAPVVHRKAD